MKETITKQECLDIIDKVGGKFSRCSCDATCNRDKLIMLGDVLASRRAWSYSHARELLDFWNECGTARPLQQILNDAEFECCECKAKKGIPCAEYCGNTRGVLYLSTPKAAALFLFLKNIL